MIYAGVLVLFLFFAFLLQDFVVSLGGAFLALCGAGTEAMDWTHHGRLLLLPAFFFPACVTVPFAGMLGLAFACGFFWDCTQALVWGREFYLVAGQEGPGFGSGPILFGLLGSVLHGVRPLFLEGRRWVAVVAGGAGTFLLLLLEYLWFSFRTGRFDFPDGFWTKVVVCTTWSLLAGVVLVPVLVSGLRGSGHGDLLTEPKHRP